MISTRLKGYTFSNVVDIAFDLKEYIETFGYTPYAKTTGGKGVHICCPIEPKFSFHEVFEAAQAIAKPFVEERKNTVTLEIRKEARKGRVLVDIFRIRSGQSIVSPYSLRGRVGAPVSMPLKWEELRGLKDPKEHNIRNAADKVLRDGDAWEGIDASAVDIHTTPDRNKGEETAEESKAQTARTTGDLREEARLRKNSGANGTDDRARWK
ncbi:MAG: hypothetical protein WDO15_26780 [Bacteroidota bacterium]